MRRKRRHTTRARANYSSRGNNNNDAALKDGLLRDQHSYHAKKSGLDIKAVRDAGKHIQRKGFAGLIDKINQQ
jgi:hypothetical protein